MFLAVVVRRSILSVAAVLCSVSFGSTFALAQSDESGAPVSTWTVERGDTWLAIRNRMYPLEALMKANPTLEGRELMPGDVVRSPLVSVGEVDAAKARAAAFERELAEARAKGVELQERIVGVEALQANLTETTTRAASAENRMLVLVGTAIVLGIGLLGALAFALVTYRDARTREEQRDEAEARYGELRGALADLERTLQRRMVKLLSAHDVRVISVRDVERETEPVVEMARELKQRHAS
jgi:hypothetical protein